MRQPEAIAVAEGCGFTTFATLLLLLELYRVPDPATHADCRFLDAHMSAVLASGYAAPDRPSLKLESNKLAYRSRHAGILQCRC